MEEEKTLTLKSLEKQVKDKFAEISETLKLLQDEINIIENSLRR